MRTWLIVIALASQISFATDKHFPVETYEADDLATCMHQLASNFLSHTEYSDLVLESYVRWNLTGWYWIWASDKDGNRFKVGFYGHYKKNNKNYNPRTGNDDGQRISCTLAERGAFFGWWDFRIMNQKSHIIFRFTHN